MRAVRVHEHGGPDVLRVETVDDPIPGPGEALVRVEATGVYKTPLPWIPGEEGAGSVVSVGPGVTDLRPGERVVSYNLKGSYAELALVNADRLIAVPDDVSTRDAAAVILQGMTAHYLVTSVYALQPGDTCLVHAAAGGVGLLLCQMAKRRNAIVIGTVSTEEKAALARAAGADEVILYTRQDFVTEVKRITDGKLVQVVYDSVGATTFTQSLQCLARRGMMVSFGQSSGMVPPLDPLELLRHGSL